MHIFRPSTEVQIHAFGVWIVKLVIGAIFVALAGGFALIDYRTSLAAKQPLHTSHLAICAVIAVLGLLVPFAPFVLPVVQRVTIFIAPYLPTRFGRRADDVPAPVGVAPGTPVAPPPERASRAE